MTSARDLAGLAGATMQAGGNDEKDVRAMAAVVMDVMTFNVIWVEEDAPFAAMAAALRQHRVSAFPVVDKKQQVIGIVSEADLLAKEALGGGDGRMPGMITGLLRHREMAKARGVMARDVMTAPAVTVSPEATVEHAAQLMYLHRAKTLPVVDSGDRLMGIVSQADLLSVYGRPDEDIRADVLGGMTTRDAAHPETVSVAVKDGVVTFGGVPESAEAGHEIVRRARHVDGVVAVLDGFTYPPAEPGRFDVLASSPAD
jgi:CBS domain-containing protein